MDFDFKGTFDNLTQGKRVHRYKLVDGFLFKDGRACVGIGHFGVPKTLDLLNEQFFWPKMKHYVERICRCLIQASQIHNWSVDGYFYGLCVGTAQEQKRT